MLRTILIAASLVTATQAQAFMAENRLIVIPTGSQDFTVPWRGESAAAEFWCAAGDYVRRELGMPGTTRIYRTSGPRRSGQGVDFSLSPEGAQPTGLLRLFTDSRGVSAAHARMLCDRFKGVD